MGRLQAVGAAIASIVAESSIAIIQMIYIRKEIELKRVLKPTWRYLVSALCMGGVMWLIGRNLESSICATALLVCGGGFVYILLLLGLKDEMIYDVLLKVKKRIGKGN